MESTRTDDGIARTWPLWATLALLVVGTAVAAWLVLIKIRLGYDSTYVSACNMGGKLNCDAVQTHPTSSLFGLPVALYALPTYAVMAVLALIGQAREEHSRRALTYLAGIGTLTVLHAAWLAYVSAAHIGSFCTFCMTLYVVNLGATVFAFVALGSGPVAVAKEALAGLAARQGPLGAPAMVFIGTAAVSWFSYDVTRQTYMEEQQARIAAQFAGSTGGGAAGAEAQPEAAPAPAQTGAATTASAPKKAAATCTPAKVTPKLTKNGWDYYEIPVGPDDYVLGPANAPVTYVVFKDFECSFCRFVANQEKRLKTKYKEEVRWVYKNYPMNADCNWRMGGERMHEGACRAAFAAYCAHEQGKFWVMHDTLYENQPKFSDEELKGYAQKVGLDMAKYSECRASQRPLQKIKRDLALAAKMRIMGTPRIYVNNRALDGSKASDVLDYVIRTAMKHPPDGSTPDMVRAKTATRTFWIDAFEGSIDRDGVAHSLPGVMPAQTNWFEAKAACEKSGKRLCTEEEWVSACAGEPAVEYVGPIQRYRKTYTNGPVVGRMYPYGALYQKGRCRDSEDKYTGEAGKTGVLPGCRTPDGVYDLAGNYQEWVGHTPEGSTMMGGEWRSESSSGCRAGSKTYGAGIKNDTTGFRCCADTKVAAKEIAGSLDAASIDEIVGGSIPKDLDLEIHGGADKLTPKSFRGKVTFLTFFASWCGNCRKQMPAIKAWQDEWKARGFQVVAIDVDREKAKGERYVKTLNPNFTIAYDPTAQSMTDFDINAMPTSFIVDRKGKIVKRVIGYKDDNIPDTRRTIQELLGG